MKLKVVCRTVVCKYMDVLAGRCRYSTSTDFRRRLFDYHGGSVDLLKDETSGIAKIVLNHPERKNALCGRMMCNLADILDDLKNWSNGKGLIIYGADHTFCSGLDLRMVQKIIEPDDGAKMSEFMHFTLTKLQKLPLISVALIQGTALGGGAELTTACDFRLFSPKATLSFPQARLGITPGFGAGYKLVQITGHMRALELLSTCKVLNYKEALEYNLANGIVSDETAIEDAHKWLCKMVVPHSETIQAIKTIVSNGSHNMCMEEALSKERNIFKSLWGGKLHKEALQNGEKLK